MPVRGRYLLGAAGGTRTPHIMQFRPVRVECPDEKLAPGSPDFIERAGFAFSAVRRGERGFWRDGCHDAARCFSLAACAA
jgi:hypothetical protein